MSALQRVWNPRHHRRDLLPILYGPFEWEVEGHTFRTVLVAVEGLPSQRLAVIDTRSGHMLSSVKLRKRSPVILARAAVAAHLEALKGQFGPAEVARRIAGAPTLPETMN